MSEEICICLIIILVVLVYEYIKKKQKKDKKKKNKEAVQAYKNKMEKQNVSLENALISVQRNEERNRVGPQFDMPNRRRVSYARGPERAYI